MPSPADRGAPGIIAEEPDYLVVWKPAGLPSAPLKTSPPGDTLLGIIALDWPETASPLGRQPWEGGLVHRLDSGTEGLVIIARSQAGLERLLALQESGRLVKEYGAVSLSAKKTPPPGFPPPPETVPAPGAVIESGFRPWGPGRKAVRPLPPGNAPAGNAGKKQGAWDRGAPYRTTIRALEEREGRLRLTLEIRRGFRHQIRCHLAWLGWPLAGDLLYGAAPGGGNAPALRAQAIRLPDPRSGAEREYRVPPIPWP